MNVAADPREQSLSTVIVVGTCTAMIGKIVVFASLLLIMISNQAASQVCSFADEELLKQRRLRGLRASILAQLGLTEAPIVNKTAPSPGIMEAYKAISEANPVLERARDQKCQNNDFYAHPVNSFVGTMVPVPINAEGQ